jgi:PII-like signaling protein
LSGPASRLTVRFGERTRKGGDLLAGHLMLAFRTAGIDSAVVLRGVEGFGLKHGLRTAGQLTLSEDLPMTAIALGPPEEVQALAPVVRSLLPEGLVTVERSHLETGPLDQRSHQPGPASGTQAVATRLTVWSRRRAKINGRPAWAALTEHMKSKGAIATITLLGVDGVSRGDRRRASFFSSNPDVPLLIAGIWPGPGSRSIRAGLAGLLPEATVESSSLLMPGDPAFRAPGGSEPACLAIYGGGLHPETGVQAHKRIIRMLRKQSAPGATVSFGLFGHAGSEPPHGETFFSLARKAPVLTEIVDSVENCLRWSRQIEDLNLPANVTTLGPVRRLSRPGDPA